MEDTTPTQIDEPIVSTEVQEAPSQATPVETTVDAESQPQQTETATPEKTVESDDDEDDYRYQPVTPTPPIDFSQLPADENGLLDPNALASMINKSIIQAEQNAVTRAQQAYAEQEQEKKLWSKAYDKYPELKSDKELQSLVHQARIGEATDILSRTKDPSSVKLPTPTQVAEKLFKRFNSAKTAGMQQATTNTVIQKSAQLETASRTSDASAETVQSARANINSPNKQVANQARQDLLKKYLGWE